jgi:general secretion pathway protein K
MRRRGFALILVLWTLVLVALIIAQLDAAGRSEMVIAGNLRANAEAEAAADGAIAEASFKLLDTSDAHWWADGSTRILTLSNATIRVSIVSETGKIELNGADPSLIAALLQGIGVESDKASALADAIADWRDPGESPRPQGAKLPQYRAAGLDYGPPDAPFQSLDEVRQVLGMTPAIADALIPHVTIYSFGQPDPAYADPEVIQAMKRVGMLLPNVTPPAPTPIPYGGMMTVTITAEAVTKSGGRFTRRASLRIGAMFPQAYQVLTWESPPAA